jgi:hypothetical protein
MNRPEIKDVHRYRVWLVRFRGRPPRTWRAVPGRITAVQPAFSELATSTEADAFIETFNRQMLQQPTRWWAVRVPVRLAEVPLWQRRRAG